MNQTQKNLTVLENQWVTLECTVTNRTSPASQLSVEWYVWKSGHPEKEAVVQLSRQGTLLYGELATLSDLKGRLHLESPSPGLYLLTIQNMMVQDSGAYDCRMEEWLLDPSNQWYKRAEDLSGLTTVTVKQPGNWNLWVTFIRLWGYIRERKRPFLSLPNCEGPNLDCHASPHQPPETRNLPPSV